ncbi:unnamed protein product [Prorocentrum cordatum]|uniref:Uncharacterized protein n=1 Tax=Prorocentrum cordatum TaxID=2364126 RepID=A0ABN9R7C1_9DINO|nr:unnamed protein product [Polarella glacialis]
MTGAAWIGSTRQEDASSTSAPSGARPYGAPQGRGGGGGGTWMKRGILRSECCTPGPQGSSKAAGWSDAALARGRLPACARKGGGRASLRSLGGPGRGWGGGGGHFAPSKPVLVGGPGGAAIFLYS